MVYAPVHPKLAICVSARLPKVCKTACRKEAAEEILCKCFVARLCKRGSSNAPRPMPHERYSAKFECADVQRAIGEGGEPQPGSARYIERTYTASASVV
jgi:hypothetical protein